LRDTIAWSHDLLSPSDQILLRRLAVFAGGCTAEAAEAVCAGPLGAADPGLPAGSVLDGLASLVEQSLVVQHPGPGGEPRFGMLETIHEFSREQLTASGERESLCRRHGAYLLQLSESARRALMGPAQAEWVQRLEFEHHNLRAALDWALAGTEAEMALRQCAALTLFWYIKGHYREGRDWCARALAAAPAGAAATRAMVLHGAASLADIQHDHVEARSLIEASVALWRTVGHRRGLASSLSQLGELARHSGDRAAARQACEEALAIYAESPYPWGQRLALGVLGWVAEDEGDHATARRLLEQSLEVARKGRSPIDVALQLNNLGIVAIRQGDEVESEARHREALLLCRDVDAHEPMACSLEGLAAVAAARRHPRRAAWLLGAATALRGAIGSPRIAQFEEEYRRVLPSVQAALGEAVFATAAAEGAAAQLHEVIAVAVANVDQVDTPDVREAPPVSLVISQARQVRQRIEPPDGLSARQIDYLRLLARGHTNKEIAGALAVSETAVEQMLPRIYEKIHVRNRAEAGRYAYEHGLIDHSEP
jgi:DNA-binding CsgD family transcriptional regulator